MGRLIDADALIENLRGYKTIYGCPMTKRDEQVIHYVIGHIKNLEPTAYDVDKVVAELEKQLLVVEIEDEHIVPESDVDEYFELDVVPMVYAREIVRRGGVNG